MKTTKNSAVSLTFLGCIFLGLISCSSQKKVVSFTNDNINFENYNTYNIVNYKKGDQDFSSQGAIFINKIEKGITEEMNAKKYSRSKNPDVLVRYEIISSVNSNNSNTANFNRVGNRYDPFYTPFNNNSRQIEGVLLIELKSRKTKKLIWQGSLDLKYSHKTEKNENLLINAVHHIFDAYHYEAGSNKPVNSDDK